MANCSLPKRRMRPARVGVSTTGAIKFAIFVAGSIKPCASVVRHFVNVKVIYPSLLHVSMQFRLYHHLCLRKESGARGDFIWSRLLSLVVERSVNPLTASLLISLDFTLGGPSNSPDFPNRITSEGNRIDSSWEVNSEISNLTSNGCNQGWDLSHVSLGYVPSNYKCPATS